MRLEEEGCRVCVMCVCAHVDELSHAVGALTVDADPVGRAIMAEFVQGVLAKHSAGG